jgi:hypothetical protein
LSRKVAYQEIKMNMKAISFSLLYCAFLFLCGCGGAGQYQLQPKPPELEEVPLRVVVSDFGDKRGFVRNSPTRSNVKPLSWYKNFEYSRYEDQFSGGMEPFTAKAARIIAEDLEKSGSFESVRYVTAEEMANLKPGTDYDLRLDGTLNKMTAKGYWRYYSLILPFGIFANDLLWAFGLPKEVRRWDMDVDLQLVDGYRGEALGKPTSVKYLTNGQVFTIYSKKPSGLGDYRAKMPEVTNQFNKDLAAQFGSKTEAEWAAIRDSGQEFLMAQQRRQQAIERGVPPTFTFISPADGSSVRGEYAAVRWTSTIPNKLKSLSITHNGTAVESGIDRASMASDQTAPDSIPARDLTVQLAMGNNRIEAVVTDHIDNTARASLAIQRLPLMLRPERRFALLIGTGSAEANMTVGVLEAILRDPTAGQFTDVARVASMDVSASSINDNISRFGSRVLSGDLALVYVAASGSAGDLTIGSGSSSMRLADLVETLKSSIGSEEVILVLDLDMAGSGGDLESLLQNVPARWAVLVNNGALTSAHKSNGQFTMGQAFGQAFREQSGTRDSVNLEGFLDAVGAATRTSSAGAMAPVIRGRFDANITMVEFK